MCAQTNPTYNPWPCVRDADYFSDDSSTSIIPSLDPVDGEPVTSNPGSPPASQDHALPAQIQIPVAVTSSAPISLSHTNRFLMPSAKSSKALRKHREDPHWAPRPANAFIIFRCDFSRKYSCEQTDQDGQVTTQNKSLSQRAADAWRSLPQESRNYYKQLAEKEKHRHALQHPYYRFRPMRRKASATKKQFLQHPYSGTGPVQPLLSSDPHPASAPRSSSNTSRIDDSRGAPLDSQALGGHPAGMVRQRVPSAPQHNMLSVSHIVPSDRHPRRPRSFSAGIDVMRQPAYVMHSLPPLPCPPHGAQPHPHSPQQVQLQSTYGESLKSEVGSKSQVQMLILILLATCSLLHTDSTSTLPLRHIPHHGILPHNLTRASTCLTELTILLRVRQYLCQCLHRMPDPALRLYRPVYPHL